MFGIGGDDKDKLKENMEDIKDLINNSSSLPAEDGDTEEDPGNEDFEDLEDQGLDDFDDESFDEDFSDEENKFDTGQDVEGQQDLQEDRNQDLEGQQDFEEPVDKTEKFETSSQPETESFDQNFQELDRGGQNPGEQDNREEQRPSEQESQEVQRDVQENERTRREGSRLKDSIPNPPETKQLNVPEIDKGPLFIRRQKFESAKNMIEEMRYLSQEIEEVVNELERGIGQDQKIEKEAKELLHAMEQDRNDVKGIIFPGSDQ